MTSQRNNITKMISPPGGGTIDASKLAQLAQEKEQEWRELQQLRNQSLESALKEKDQELKEEKNKFNRLKEDFKYNLKLLNDRDAELATYDTTLTDLRKAIVSRDSEISELKIKLHELQNTAAREASIRDDLQSSYQKRIREKQAELDQYRMKKDAEIEEERKELESFRRNLQRQIKDIEEEMELQKQQLTTGFEDAMRKREHEFRQQLDEMNTTVLSHELKVKLLSKELEVCKSSQAESSTEREKAEGSQRHLEKELRNKEWQLQDVTAMKNVKISELEGKLKNSEGNMKRLEEECQRKLKDMDRNIREKDVIIKKLKETLSDSSKQCDEKIRAMESKLEQLEIKLRQSEWNSQDLRKDKDAVIERLEADLGEAHRQIEKLQSEKAKVIVSQEMEMQKLTDSEQQLQIRLKESMRHLERYKKELQEALEHQSSLEQSKAQLDLDWQRRLDEVERQQYERSEDLVKNLMKAKDEALAEVKQKDRELTEKNNLLKVLTEDRDRALATIKQYGLKVDHNIDLKLLSDIPKSAAEEMGELQKQNNNLREVIHQMRSEMEKLGEHMPQQITKSSRNPVTQDYVKNLEKEIHKLKIKNRELEENNQDNGISCDKETTVIATDNALIQQHIASLNNTISQLRSEKVDLSAQLRKHQARLQYLETSVDDTQKLQMEKQVQVEQLQYELGAAVRRHNLEMSSLRRQLTESQLQLDEARKEVDEYYKANLQHNQTISALEHELSTVKMELASKRQPITFGAQELLIQQLHDEIERLQHERKGESNWDEPIRAHLSDTSDVTQLRHKLHQAAKHIGVLAREKQQLIEVNNRLRADLNKNGIKPTMIARSRSPAEHMTSLGTTGKVSDRNYINETMQSKLKQLEQLQYEITKQQLNQGKIDGVQILRISRDLEDENFQPRSILKNSGPQEIPTKLEKSSSGISPIHSN